MEMAVKQSVAVGLVQAIEKFKRDWEIAEETGDIPGQNEAIKRGVDALREFNKLMEDDTDV